MIGVLASGGMFGGIIAELVIIIALLAAAIAIVLYKGKGSAKSGPDSAEADGQSEPEPAAEPVTVEPAAESSVAVIAETAAESEQTAAEDEQPAVVAAEECASEEEQPITQPAAEPVTAETVREELASAAVVGWAAQPEAAAEPVKASAEPAKADFASFARSAQRTFGERMEGLDEQTRSFYERLHAALTGYAGVRCRRTKRFESYLVKGRAKARITVAGKTLKLYLALDPDGYETRIYHHRDEGGKKTYARVPMALKIKSGLAVKKAERLIEILLGAQ